MPGENEKLLGSISLNPFCDCHFYWIFKINAQAKDIFMSAVSVYFYVLEYD